MRVIGQGLLICWIRQVAELDQTEGISGDLSTTKPACARRLAILVVSPSCWTNASASSIDLLLASRWAKSIKISVTMSS